MDALGNGGFWLNFPPKGHRNRSSRRNPKSSSSSSESLNLQQGSAGGWSFSDLPLKQSAIAAALSLSGDAIAQLRDRWAKLRQSGDNGVAKVSSCSLDIADSFSLRFRKVVAFLMFVIMSYSSGLCQIGFCFLFIRSSD